MVTIHKKFLVSFNLLRGPDMTGLPQAVHP